MKAAVGKRMRHRHRFAVDTLLGETVSRSNATA